MDSGFIVTLVAYAELFVLVTERDLVRAPVDHPGGRRVGPEMNLLY